MTERRQLAAIMFTDIQGYTSLMHKDEEQAIKIRNKHRKVFKEITEKYNGRILQYYGDGTLSIFDSAYEAVKCGVELQEQFMKEPVVPVRIGIHSGDIVCKEDEVIGDGVNIASRIESIAVPGSVMISGKVYDEIKNQSSIDSTRLNAFEFKNVAKIIEVYCISNEGLVVPKASELSGKTVDNFSNYKKENERLRRKNRRQRVIYMALAVITLFAVLFASYNYWSSQSKIKKVDRSIAVLAFRNMSGDPSQEYFSDGISEEILNSLVKIEGLKVAGRTSSFSYKGKDVDIQTIGNELGVSMVLEGSIRKSEDR
ncbi:MAG: adenylate/guanylate cyclase domain-containing protein, partial [Draconibacterium sp.]|nr:adenylate/guanylate cyclase domain-containing protein [Draconibacterium sp.]